MFGILNVLIYAVASVQTHNKVYVIDLSFIEESSLAHPMKKSVTVFSPCIHEFPLGWSSQKLIEECV